MTPHNPILRTLRRLRHYRGHGIHSPLVYGLVREVFMRRVQAEGDLYDTLRQAGMRPCHASEVSRVYHRLGCDRFTADGGMIHMHKGGSLYATCLPGRDRRAVQPGRCLSIDRRRYALFIFDETLPDQHFIL